MNGGSGFKTRFKARFNTDIQLYAPYAYDAARVMIDAMKRANSADPSRYLPLLAKTDYQGLTGRIGFDAKGDLQNGAITLYQSKAGQWQALETVGGGDVSTAALAAGLDKVAEGAKPAGSQSMVMDAVKAAEDAVKAPAQKY